MCSRSGRRAVEVTADARTEQADGLMCGLCGTLCFDRQASDPALITAMLRQLRRRGPDAEGRWSDAGVTLGHRRLAIIDLDPRADQPMVEADGSLALVFNGTVYNYPQLRSELEARGHGFVTHSDTETILKAYREWGEACVEHLDGMFAFAIWDRQAQSLFLARDRLGIKPLYYARTSSCFCFASNTQALLEVPGLDLSINPAGLHHLFTLHAVIPAPDTILSGIRKLPPATWMKVDADGGVTQQRYWTLDARRPARSYSEWEWVEMIRESLAEAVKKRIEIADVPVGVLLSGGLDSSLLVGLLVEAGVSDLRTYSVGFEDAAEEKGSEFEYSDLVVQRFRTRHHKFSIDNAQVLERLPEAVDAMAEPMFGQDAIGFYLLAERVSQHVKVVQSGQGADEVFAGYFWYPRMQAEQGTDLERFRRHYFDRDHAEFEAMISADFCSKDYTSETIEALLAQPGADEYIDRVLRMDVTTLIVDDPVKRVDNMTMAWGLEARVPFLDHRLVELAAQMPPEYKLGSGGKHVLKRICRGLLPDAVIDREKGYFPVPALKYVRGELLEFMAEVLNSQACRQRGLYRRSYVEKLLREPEKHLTRIQGSKLWHLTLLEFWLQRHLP